MAPAYGSGRLFIGDEVGFLWCLNATNGQLEWSLSFNRPHRSNFYSTVSVAPNGWIIAGAATEADNAAVKCLHPENGTTVWELTRRSKCRPAPSSATT